MAFDPSRNVTVLFGGSVYNHTTLLRSGESDETWEWNGSAWQQRSVVGPSARSRHAMAFDPVRQLTILYGGTTGSNEMWLFDGAAWTQVPQQDVWPGDRVDAALAFDPTRSVVVLHSPGSSTMEWNGASWRVAAETSPLADHAALAFDATSSSLVALAKSPSDHAFASWNGSEWTVLPNAPAIPATHELVSLPSAGVLSFGLPSSVTNTQLREPAYLWASGVRSIPPKFLAPPPAQYGAMAFDSLKEETVLAVPPPGSPGRADTWVLNGERWRQVPTSRLASAVMFTSATSSMGYDPARHEMILVSPSVQRRASDGTWSFNASNTASGVAGAGFSPVHGLMFLTEARMQRWNGSALEAWGPTNAVDSFRGGFAFDPVRNRGVAVSQGGTTRLLDPLTQAWSSFSFNTVSSFEPRLEYAPERGGVVLFGGFSLPQIGTHGFANTTYLLGSTSSAWQAQPLRGPMGRKRHATAYDSVTQRFTMFGGLGGHEGSSTFLGGTWFLSKGPAEIVRERGTQRTPLGGHAEFAVCVKGGGPLSFQWYKDNDRLQDSATISGTSSDTLRVAAATLPNAGTYHCVVSNRCGSDSSTPMLLDVDCPADLDDDGSLSNGSLPDGVVDSNDLLFFVSAFEAGSPEADLDNGGGTWAADNAVTIDDLLFFLLRFEAGC